MVILRQSGDAAARCGFSPWSSASAQSRKSSPILSCSAAPPYSSRSGERSVPPPANRDEGGHGREYWGRVCDRAGISYRRSDRERGSCPIIIYG